MLPGFRFIVMTLVLATSVLIFGLGAAALLRATHEQFASMPSLRTPEQQLPATFAERFGSPTLSLLRVDPASAPEHAGAKDADVASLNGESDTQLRQSSQDNEPAARPRAHRRLTQARRAHTRAVVAQKRRFSTRRAVAIRTAQKSTAADVFPPPLFGN
jgi:hypothetical protein